MTIATLSRNHGYTQGIGGLRLHYRTWEVPSARGALLVVPGFSDYGGRYGGFAEQLAEFGFSTFALDLRGHGASEGRRGFVNRFSSFLQDLDRFRREVHGLVDPRCPLFLFGHSMGGLITLRYLQEFDTSLRGAVVSSPWLATRAVAPWQRSVGRVLARVLPALPLPANIAPDHISHDAGAVKRYRDDPMVHGTITPRLFVEIEAAAARVDHEPDGVRIPLLMLVAGDDRLIDPEPAIRFAESADDQVTLKRYPGYFHEVWNEADSGVVLGDIRDWLVAHLA